MTKKEMFEILKNNTNDADVIAFVDSELNKIERRELKTQLKALTQLANSMDIETVKMLKQNLIDFAKKNF